VSGDGVVLLEAENTVVTGRDCTGHAELNLMRAASRTFSAGDLASCTLYSSAEPCAMCAGAIYWGNVGRVVFALSAKATRDAVGDAHDIPTLAIGCREVLERTPSRIEVSGPHREADARAVHERFWAAS
jgi:tRNA(Arg) A34 adenosine deaminase TadA